MPQVQLEFKFSSRLDFDVPTVAFSMRQIPRARRQAFSSAIFHTQKSLGDQLSLFKYVDKSNDYWQFNWQFINVLGQCGGR